MNYRLIFFLTFIALGIWGWFYQLNHTNNTDNSLILQENHRPDYVGKTMHAVVFSPEGRKNYIAIASKASHFNTLNRTDFELPQVFMFDVESNDLNKKDWQLSALSASLENLETLHLMSNVQIKNLTDDFPLNTINTEDLTYHLPSGDFSAKNEAFITGDSFLSKSSKFSGNLKRKQITLENQVNSHYEITPR